MKPKLHSTSFRAILSSLSYFLSYFQSVINEISAQPRKPESSLSSVLEISHCSIFNDRLRRTLKYPLAEALHYYTSLKLKCQYLFSIFFDFFITFLFSTTISKKTCPFLYKIHISSGKYYLYINMTRRYIYTRLEFGASGV